MEEQPHGRSMNDARTESATSRPEPEDVLSGVQRGMVVRDKTGEDVGHVAEIYSPHIVDAQEAQLIDSYVKVDTGFFGRDLYVPGRFIGTIADDGIQLTVNKDIIPDLVWERPEFIPE